MLVCFEKWDNVSSSMKALTARSYKRGFLTLTLVENLLFSTTIFSTISQPKNIYYLMK